MNITFLVGNGFDIGLGLHTSYESFYKRYCKIGAEDSENIKDFKTMLSKCQEEEYKKIIDWADFETAFGQHSADFTAEEKMLYVERFEHFVSEFNAYLENEIGRADFSDVDSIGKVMDNAVKTYFHIREADRIAIQDRYNKQSGARTYNFMSFNYTESVDKCAAALKSVLKGDKNRQVGSIVHVHGFIEENMIMGVNDPAQIKNLEFSNDPEIIREIVKPQQNISTRTTYDEKATTIIKNSQIICVYGMSIGCTDAKWWDLISAWLEGSPLRALVILVHDKGANKRFPFKQNRCVDDVIQKFLSYSTRSEEVKRRIMNQIYVGMNHDVFAMPLCKAVMGEPHVAPK